MRSTRRDPNCLHCAVAELITSREHVSAEDLIGSLCEVLFDFIDVVPADNRDEMIAELISRVRWGIKLVNDREWATNKMSYTEFNNARPH